MIGVVPARGGSKGIRRKNLQPVNGVPLVANAIQTLRAAGCDPVYVTSDDDEIRSVASAWQASLLDRPAALAGDDATIDQVCDWLVDVLDAPFLLLQPTVIVDPDDVWQFLNAAAPFDPGRNVVAGYQERHLTWTTPTRPPKVRANRQDEAGWRWREVGLRYWTHQGPPQDLYDLARPVVDIDTPRDLAAAQNVHALDVGIRVHGTQAIGSGHVRRCIQIADRLHHADIRFATHHAADPFVTDMIHQAGYVTMPTGCIHPDVWINDTLDTKPFEMAELLRFAPVVTLEDHGPGAAHATHVINALYAESGLPNERHGADWIVLRPEFTAPYRPRTERRGGILVTFGGTDPADYTSQLSVLFRDATVIWPPNRTPGIPGESHMAAAIGDADIVVCSAGTTLYEAARLGTPAVVLAQNPRETAHAHLGPEFGNVYLGLHPTDDQIRYAVGVAERHWQELSTAGRRLVDGHGLDRIVRLIEETGREHR